MRFRTRVLIVVVATVLVMVGGRNPENPTGDRGESDRNATVVRTQQPADD